MTMQSMSKEDLMDMMRTIVREELSLQNYAVDTLVSDKPTVASDERVDQITDAIFDKYDDVFRALA